MKVHRFYAVRREQEKDTWRKNMQRLYLDLPFFHLNSFSSLDLKSLGGKKAVRNHDGLPEAVARAVNA